MFLPVIFTILAAFFYYEDSGWTLAPDLNMTLFWSAVFATLALYSYIKLRRIS